MLGLENESNNDFMGYLSAKNTYDVFTDPDESDLSKNIKGNIKKSLSKFNDLLKTKRLGYFGLEEPKTKDKRVSEAYKKRVYHMLAIVGQIRQSVFHDKSNELDEYLYSFIDIIDSEYRETLDYLIDERFDSINKGFIQGNKVNISLLIDMMKDDYEADDIIRLYYDFIVLKSQKKSRFFYQKSFVRKCWTNTASDLRTSNMTLCAQRCTSLWIFCFSATTTEMTLSQAKLLCANCVFQ